MNDTFYEFIDEYELQYDLPIEYQHVTVTPDDTTCACDIKTSVNTNAVLKSIFGKILNLKTKSVNLKKRFISSCRIEDRIHFRGNGQHARRKRLHDHNLQPHGNSPCGTVLRTNRKLARFRIHDEGGLDQS